MHCWPCRTPIGGLPRPPPASALFVAELDISVDHDDREMEINAVTRSSYYYAAMTSRTPWIFVSHAWADRELSDLFVEKILRLGCGVPADQIVYTSRTSTGVPGGSDFRVYIRERAEGASLVIAIITDAFLSSAFCMNEVGAAWVLGKDFYPIAAPGLPYSKLDGVLPGLQVSRMDTPGVLDDLAERVTKALMLSRNSADWGTHAREFQERLGKWPNPVDTFSAGRNSVGGLVRAAESVTREWIAGSLREFRGEGSSSQFIYGQVTPLQNIRAVIESAHRELERHYAVPPRRSFKVNFMTKSFADGEITIAAWANRAERRPSSLRKRANNPHVYQTTKTAEVYRMDEPLPIIVDDTYRPEHSGNYVLDAHQRDRIRSHLVWPVLCPLHELLGTFVIDCTEAGFFRSEDEVIWEDFCEAHARPLALEMLRLRSAILRESPAEGPASWSRPPF